MLLIQASDVADKFTTNEMEQLSAWCTGSMGVSFRTGGGRGVCEEY